MEKEGDVEVIGFRTLHRSCAKCLWGFRSPSNKDLGAFFFVFLEGRGPWGTRVGVSGLEKSWLKFLLNASYSGWAFSSNLGL